VCHHNTLLSTKHCKAHLDFAYAHKDWTVKDWRRVVWSDVAKGFGDLNCILCLPSGDKMNGMLDISRG
jgi:hypothetical protein